MLAQLSCPEGIALKAARLADERVGHCQQQGHSWAVYHIKGTPAKLVGIIGTRPTRRLPLLERSRNTTCHQRAWPADGAAAGLSCPQNESASALDGDGTEALYGTDARGDLLGGQGGSVHATNRSENFLAENRP